MSQRQASNGLWLGAIVGGALGAITALLLAPKSGVQLRGDLAQTCRAIGRKTKDIASTVGQSTIEIAAAVREETHRNTANSMAPTEEDIHKLGKEMERMETNSQIISQGMIPDPKQ